MTNKSNNHEQIILKNKEGLYVITPSLNKSYKFESTWPDNSSQAYILSSIIKDIKDDKNATVGNVELHNCTNTIVHTADERRAVIVGLHNYIVSEKSGQLLICPLSDEQHIKEYSQQN